MGLKGNRGYGKMLAEAAKKAVDDPNFEPAPFTRWLDTWFEPVKARNRFRWLFRDYLTDALEEIPSEVTIRYLEEMIVDLRELDKGQAWIGLSIKYCPSFCRTSLTKGVPGPARGNSQHYP